MRLNIIQEGRLYQFFKNEDENPYLTGEVIQQSSSTIVAQIYDLGDRPVAVIKRGVSPGLFSKKKATFLLSLVTGQFEVSIASAWKGHWTFSYRNHLYDFYFHYGYEKSLFKSGEQVAKYDARETYPLDSRKAFVVANNDEDDLLLLCLFLIFDKESALDPELPRNNSFLGRGMRESNMFWFPVR